MEVEVEEIMAMAVEAEEVVVEVEEIAVATMVVGNGMEKGNSRTTINNPRRISSIGICQSSRLMGFLKEEQAWKVIAHLLSVAADNEFPTQSLNAPWRRSHQHK